MEKKNFMVFKGYKIWINNNHKYTREVKESFIDIINNIIREDMLLSKSNYKEMEYNLII